jgi:hypothetical protein
MAVFDRVKGSLQAIARGANAFVDYQVSYRCKVLKQNAGGNRVDIQPEDPRLPSMANVPLWVGVPGAEVHLLPGHLVELAFQNGWPDRPRVTAWEPGTAGTTPTKATLHASTMELGGPVTPVQDGVVTGQGKDPYTGLPYWMLGNSSTSVGAKR